MAEEKRKAEEEKRLVEESVSFISHIYAIQPKLLERDGVMRENREISIKSKKRDLEVRSNESFIYHI